MPSGTTAIGVNTGVDVNALGNRGTISFWYAASSDWNDGQNRMLLDASQDLGASDRHFLVTKRGSGALTFSLTDSAGAVLTTTTASTAYPANEWHHISVRWDLPAGSASIYLDGGLVASASASLNGSLGDVATLYLGARRMAGVTGTPAGYTSNTANGYVDELRLFSAALDPLEIEAMAAYTYSCGSGLHHIELRHASGSGLNCTPSSLTVVACQDASCATPYTGGVSGALGASSGTLGWPAGNSFSIAPGSSSTAVALQVTTAGSASLTGAATSPTATGGTSCNFGAPSCSFTAADAGLLFDVPHHRAESSQSVAVTAVKKADNSASCTPAFASVSKNASFKCSYSNPATGTLPVRLGGAALNAANNSAASCDADGRAVSLAFDATGKAVATLQYADAGALTLMATHTGSGSDAGLVMTGSDSFTTAPYDLAVGGITSSKIAAGSNFSGTVTARNFAGAATPNFGREAVAEGVLLSFTRTQPTGAGAVTGGFVGAAGSFSSGVANATTLAYSEVGQGTVGAALASGSYLGSALSASGTSAAISFKPHHFDLSITPGCGTFSYAGQALNATVTARNAGGSSTLNYDGSANTSPNFALATTLADNPALTAGSVSGGSVAASAYNAGVASASLSFGFVNELTVPLTLVLRASDSDGVSSAGYTEGSTVLRSGRLRLSNSFGKATASLQLPVTAEYWGGSAWLFNGADSCTTLAAANVVLSNPRTAMGGASTATTSASVGNLAAGRATLTLAAPSPAGSSLSLDLALNLGASATDASCNTSHPASTGAMKPWLRSRHGSCAATDDRDTATRASFGIFSTESRRQIDARDLF